MYKRKLLRFGGIAPSKPKTITEITIIDFGVKYTYSKKNKIQTDQHTAIYFGLRNGKDNVVIKIVKDSYTEVSQLMNERNVYYYLQPGKHFPKFYTFIPPKENGPMEYTLITEQFGPSLENLLERYKKMDLPFCLNVLYQGIEALEQLHSIGYVHNDIKTGNMCIGLNDPENIKLIDFGITWRYPENKKDYSKALHKITGTPYYVSPEIFYGKGKARLRGRNPPQRGWLRNGLPPSPSMLRSCLVGRRALKSKGAQRGSWTRARSRNL